MLNRKACLVFTFGLEKEVPPITAQLTEEGFNVCTASADQEVVEAAQAGSRSVPEAVRSCIENAQICVFLIPNQESVDVINAAGYACSQGNRIIAVVENIHALPQIFDDIAFSVVCIGSPGVADAFKGRKVWETPNGSADGKREIQRIKCQ